MFLKVALPDNHPLRMNYEEFYQAVVNQQAALEARRLAHKTPKLFPALLVRYAQVRVSLYFQQQTASSLQVGVESFMDMFTKMALSQAWEPDMPAEILKILAPPPPAAVVTGTTPAAGGSTNTRTNARTTPPAGTAPTTRAPPAPAAGAAAAGANNRMLQNDHPNAAFAPYKALGLKIKTILDRTGREPLPKAADGTTDMCLSFHVKHFCSSGCGRAVDHVTHTTEQDATLLAWCATNYVSS